jgi:hypothetical protein
MSPREAVRPTGVPQPARRLAGGPLPRPFRRRVATLPVGGSLAYDERDWVDALVVIDRGDVELEGRCGTRYRFGPGAILWLVGLPLRAIHNVGDDPAVLVAVSRRGPPRPELPHVTTGSPRGTGSHGSP